MKEISKHEKLTLSAPSLNVRRMIINEMAESNIIMRTLTDYTLGIRAV